MTNYNFVQGEQAGIKLWTKGVQVEDAAMRQLLNVAKLPFVHRHIAALPDVHWGMGATVGSVIATKGAIIPAAVGVDIGCVDRDTEYLSSSGWRRCADYDGGLLMQYETETGTGRLIQPERFITLPCSEFLHLKTKYGINQMLSADHRVLCWMIRGRERRREITVISAEELAAEHDRLVLGVKAEFETSFTPIIESRLDLTDEQIRVQVMVMADGWLDTHGHKTVIRLKKDRKIERARVLLAAAGIEFSVRQADPGVTELRFAPPLWTKTYLELWSASEPQLQVIAEECLRWDGNQQERCFYTRDRPSADFIQYAFTATGSRSVMREDQHSQDGKLDFRVYAIHGTRVGLQGVPKTPIKRVASTDGLMYCFTVPSGYWVMRRAGNIAMTGNCGMAAQQTTLTAADLPDNLLGLRSEIEQRIPHGRTNNGHPGDRGAWGELPPVCGCKLVDHMPELYNIVAKHPKLAQAAERAPLHAGTLGTGNHFVEVCLDEADRVWIMLHSGSRGIGNRIGSYFIELAKKDMERWFINLPDKDLAYLPQGSELFDDYWQALHWAQEFARINRELMMQAALDALRISVPKEFFCAETAVNCHHNYVSWENHFGANVMVTRKGAVRAREGDLGIIPGSMGARSFIVSGKGNRESFCSCSHGAGRAMSRTEARRRFNLEDHALATAGVECRKDMDVIDETPAAYKDIDAVMAAQAELVNIEHTLKQVVCVKG